MLGVSWGTVLLPCLEYWGTALVFTWVSAQHPEYLGVSGVLVLFIHIFYFLAPGKLVHTFVCITMQPTKKI
jgi:hypothetical protein